MTLTFFPQTLCEFLYKINTFITSLATKMERNGRKSSRISFPVSASPLPGGGQVTAGTT